MLRDDLRAELDALPQRVMVCGANWDGEHAGKRRQIAEEISAGGDHITLVVPERDPAPESVGAATDELELAKDCDVLVILIEPAEAARGAWGEAATFSAAVDAFEEKALILVPESAREKIENGVGFHEHEIRSHPEDHRVFYTAEQYRSCALRVRVGSFLRTRRSIEAKRLYRLRAEQNRRSQI